jgi:hypothetical protein
VARSARSANRGIESRACKRMPMFRSEKEADAFKGVYREYVEI